MSYDKHFKKMKSGAAGQKQNLKPKAQQKVKKQMKSKRSNKKDNTPWSLFIILMIGTVLSLWGYNNLEEVDHLLSRVEIGFLGQAAAQQSSNGASGGEQSTSATGPNQANNAAAGNPDVGLACPPATEVTEEELSHYSKLAERKEQLDLREKELAKMEEDLHKQKAEIEVRIKKLESIRANISGVLKERVEVDEQRVTTLVDFYSNMKPKQAAEVFNTLNEDLAIEVLGRMKKKNAAAIMNLLEPAKARTLSEKFTGYKKR